MSFFFPDADIVIFLTQDAVLADSLAVKNIIKAFDDSQVGVAYGRQLPRPAAGIIESHARLFNYSDESSLRSLQDKHRLGIKAAFTSNSFAAYRVSALMDVGGFPSNTIVSEDMYVAAKMLINGWKVAYCSDAKVFHSHDYNLTQEFQRYFDIGVFNAKEPWIRDEFGNAESEGGKFVKSEMKVLLSSNPLMIPEALFRTFLKLLGYKLGLKESLIPKAIKCFLSAQKGYWK